MVIGNDLRYSVLKPFITKGIVEKIDEYVETVLRSDDICAVISIRDRRIKELSSSIGNKNLPLTLSVYADIARKTWHVKYERNRPKYVFSQYVPGQPHDAYTRIDAADFPVVHAYLDRLLAASKYVSFDHNSFQENGIRLKTSPRWTGLMLSTLFSLDETFIVTRKKR